MSWIDIALTDVTLKER